MEGSTGNVGSSKICFFVCFVFKNQNERGRKCLSEQRREYKRKMRHEHGMRISGKRS